MFLSTPLDVDSEHSSTNGITDDVVFVASHRLVQDAYGVLFEGCPDASKSWCMNGFTKYALHEARSFLQSDFGIAFE